MNIIYVGYSSSDNQQNSSGSVVSKTSLVIPGESIEREYAISSEYTSGWQLTWALVDILGGTEKASGTASESSEVYSFTVTSAQTNIADGDYILAVAATHFSGLRKEVYENIRLERKLGILVIVAGQSYEHDFISNQYPVFDSDWSGTWVISATVGGAAIQNGALTLKADNSAMVANITTAETTAVGAGTFYFQVDISNAVLSVSKTVLLSKLIILGTSAAVPDINSFNTTDIDFNVVDFSFNE